VIREAHRNGVADTWEERVRADPQAAKEEFLRGYAATLAEVSGTRPDVITGEKGETATTRFKEMLQQTPAEFAREVLGVFVDPPDDKRMKRTEENVVACEECPYSLVCLAGRIFGKMNPHNILCVKCGQTCVVVEAKDPKWDGRTKTTVTRIKAQSFYCCERVLTPKMEHKWRRNERARGAQHTLHSPPYFKDPAPSGKEIRLGICAACEEHDRIVQRYRKQQKERYNWTWVDENDS
jgi:hypothetical protein